MSAVVINELSREHKEGFVQAFRVFLNNIYFASKSKLTPFKTLWISLQDTGRGVAVTIFGNGERYFGIIDNKGVTGNLPKSVANETIRFLSNFGEKTNYVLERCNSVSAHVCEQGNFQGNQDIGNFSRRSDGNYDVRIENLRVKYEVEGYE